PLAASSRRARIAPGPPRPPAEVLEGQGCDGRLLVERLDLEDERLDHPSGRLDLEVLALEGHVFTGSRVLDEPPATTGPDVHLLDRGGVAVRPPPAGDCVAIGQNLPDQVARSVEHALHDEVLPFGVGSRRVGAAPVNARRCHLRLLSVVPDYFLSPDPS